MSKTREFQCIYYCYEGCCDLGKDDCTFYGKMQKCKTYKKKPGSRPSRTDNRREKLDKIKSKERWN